MQKRIPGSPSSAANELRHFTNRESEQAAFRRLVDLPAGSTLPVLMFYGVGGEGKSWLLRRLRELLDDIPSARLDLDPNPKIGGTAYQNDISRALAEIRRQLDLECPRFDLAYAMIRFKEGAGEDPLFSHGTSGLAWEFIEQAAQTVASFPGGNILVWLGKKGASALGSRIKGTALEGWLLSSPGNDDFLRLRRLDPQDIYPQLTERLAIDLEDRLPARKGNACQAVICLDTFEALQRGIHSEAHKNEREGWVRELYGKLSNVLIVIAGRDRLNWEEIDPDWRKPEHLQQHLVRGLSRHDAEVFLGRRGIGDGPLRESVLRACPDTGTPQAELYHPYSLALCVDTIDNERAQDHEPEPSTFALSPGDFGALADRFLRSLPDRALETWVIRLAQTPRFDETAARAMFSSVRDVQQDTAWSQLLDFSFLRSAAEAGWYTFHPRMVEALRSRLAREPDELRRAHYAWLDHWRSRAQDETDTFASPAWYHLLQVEPNEAIERWNELIEAARRRGQMALHYRLLSWWDSVGLEARPPQDALWAGALINLGIELTEATLGPRNENLERSIACFNLALSFFSFTEFPTQWAGIQGNLGIAYSQLGRGNRGKNLRKAIDCFSAALTVYTEHEHPSLWAQMQTNLGAAFTQLPNGDRSENLQNAINCYEAALRVRTEATSPVQWANTQGNLGITYAQLPTGDQAQNLQKAIGCFKSALRVYKADEFPRQWAMTNVNLGNTYIRLPSDDRDENVQSGIDCFEAALPLCSEAEFPMQWAMIQRSLGIALRNLPTGDRGRNLRKALDCHNLALRVYTEHEFPGEWAQIQNNLGNAYAELNSGDRGENLRSAIGCFNAALRVHTESDFPIEWAQIQNNLGAACLSLPTGDRSQNLEEAIVRFKAALRVRTRASSPAEWATTQSNLGIAYAMLTAIGQSQHLQEAIDCFSNSLSFFTEADFPLDWAGSQSNLGKALVQAGQTEAARRAYDAAARGYRSVGLENNALEMEKWRDSL